MRYMQHSELPECIVFAFSEKGGCMHLAEQNAYQARGCGQVLLKGGCVHVDLGCGAVLACVGDLHHKGCLCQAWRRLQASPAFSICCTSALHELQMRAYGLNGMHSQLNHNHILLIVRLFLACVCDVFTKFVSFKADGSAKDRMGD